jgi:hypothetical protein
LKTPSSRSKQSFSLRPNLSVTRVSIFRGDRRICPAIRGIILGIDILAQVLQVMEPDLSHLEHQVSTGKEQPVKARMRWIWIWLCSRSRSEACNWRKISWRSS